MWKKYSFHFFLNSEFQTFKVAFFQLLSLNLKMEFSRLKMQIPTSKFEIPKFKIGYFNLKIGKTNFKVWNFNFKVDIPTF